VKTFLLQLLLLFYTVLLSFIALIRKKSTCTNVYTLSSINLLKRGGLTRSIAFPNQPNTMCATVFSMSLRQKSRCASTLASHIYSEYNKIFSLPPTTHRKAACKCCLFYELLAQGNTYLTFIRRGWHWSAKLVG